MNTLLLVGTVVLPSIVALVLFAVFTHLYSQTREPYVRAWQLAWAAYAAFYVLLAWDINHPSVNVGWMVKVALFAVALCIFISTRLIDTHQLRLRWYDGVIAVVGVAWAGVATRADMSANGETVALGPLQLPVLTMGMGIAVLLAVCAYRFWKHATRVDSSAFRLLAVSLVLLAAVLASRQIGELLAESFGPLGSFLVPLPQMLLGLGMVMVVYENERRAVQENLLSFSSLDIEPSKVMQVGELTGSLDEVLGRLMRMLKSERAAIYVNDPWRDTLPCAQRGFSADFLRKLESDGVGESLAELAVRSGGIATLGEASAGLLTPELQQRLPRITSVFTQENAPRVIAAALETRERVLGSVIFPQERRFSGSQVRTLRAMTAQIAMTLENFLLMHDAQRRTKEYELLTQIGQVVSSRLDRDEVLLAIHKELGQLFDTSDFYVAFQQGDEIQFELHVDDGQVQPKRSRKMTTALTEHIIRSGQPVLVRSDMQAFRERLGVQSQGARPAMSFCGVPIFMNGRSVGVMAALDYDREYAFSKRDLEVMQTAAGQLAVAMENARLFAEEQQRSRYLAFLNHISKTAISSQDAEQMLAEIVAEIQRNFRFDHIGIGILDYATKDIEIKAEAGATAKALGRRVPLGVGILGRVARTNEMSLVQDTGDGHLAGILPESKAVLCVPIAYGETLLGVLNVESQRPNAFGQQEVLALRTLADLLATALHNAFVFQKMQQQSITDGLTGIKTRRYFLEALQSEWKRAARSGRPFSVVLIDLDKFKQVNDTMGHLEGDLVLARIGRLLEQKCRQSNVVARYGGDEFVILMPETSVEQAQILSERLRLWIATDPMLNERQITGSFGVATFPLHGATVEDIVRVADAGMYSSKRAGGNRVSTAEELGMGDVIPQKQMIMAAMESFLQHDRSGPEAEEELLAMVGKLNAALREMGSLDLLKEAVRTLTIAAEAREIHGSGHGEAIARYAEAIANELSLPQDELDDLVYAARVHDVGKIVIPERILNKATALTADEFAIIKQHPGLGARVVEAAGASGRIRETVRHHHEHFDGSGYPDGLKGEHIPLGARIISVCEAFVNMTSERSYATLKSPTEAVAELEELSGTRYDGMLVRILIRHLRGEKVARSRS
jgi:diguanylate cyclase (GGDEF)-like protein